MNYPVRSMTSVTFTQMVSFSILFLVELSILRISLHPIGNIMDPVTALSRNNIFCLGDCCPIIKLLYFSLQCKYWVLYIGVSLELNIILKLVILYL